MRAVGRDAVGVGSFGRVQLPVAADDNLTVAGLPPLMQLEGIEVDEETQQAIEDWHYWVGRGYEF